MSPRATGIVRRMILFRVIGCGISLLIVFGVLALVGGRILLMMLRH